MKILKVSRKTCLVKDKGEAEDLLFLLQRPKKANNEASSTNTGITSLFSPALIEGSAAEARTAINNNTLWNINNFNSA